MFLFIIYISQCFVLVRSLFFITFVGLNFRQFFSFFISSFTFESIFFCFQTGMHFSGPQFSTVFSSFIFSFIFQFVFASKPVCIVRPAREAFVVGKNPCPADARVSPQAIGCPPSSYNLFLGQSSEWVRNPPPFHITALHTSGVYLQLGAEIIDPHVSPEIGCLCPMETKLRYINFNKIKLIYKLKYTKNKK